MSENSDPLRQRKKRAWLTANLLDAIEGRAFESKCTPDELIENICWKWLYGEHEKSKTSRLIWESLPSELRADTYAFWAYCAFRQSDLSAEAFRMRTLTKFRDFRRHPNYAANLQRLGI